MKNTHLELHSAAPAAGTNPIPARVFCPSWGHLRNPVATTRMEMSRFAIHFCWLLLWLWERDSRPLMQTVIKNMQPFAFLVIMFGIQILSFLPAKTDHLNLPLKWVISGPDMVPCWKSLAWKPCLCYHSIVPELAPDISGTTLLCPYWTNFLTQTYGLLQRSHLKGTESI